MSSGPAMQGRIVDADVRELVVRAVDRSFIVQAPAGSGKTELLTQRFLALLATVEQPEAVLAITFTRKAASEMRIRILEALDFARKALSDDELEAPEPHKIRSRELAREVLRADEKFGWRLTDNPMRLQIRTVDSLSDSIARQLPVLARVSVDLEVTEDSVDLYREAAERTLGEVGDGTRAGDAVATLLRYRDNRLSDLRKLLTSMLAKRDQWLRIIAGASNADESQLQDLRVQLEGALRRAVEEDLRKVRSGLLAVLGSDAHELVRLARVLSGSGSTHNEIPAPSADELETWRAIANMTLTKDGTVRKRVAPGFEEAADKSSCKALLDAMGEKPDDAEKICALLTKVRKLSDPMYSEDEWRFVRALLVTLVRCAAHLKLVFGDEGKIDFIEMALAAKTALEAEDGPTELAMALGSHIKHLLIDEFQDTSQSQLALINSLTRTWDEDSGNTLFLVGDPMQSIYAFREAEVTIFTRAFKADTSGARDLRWAVEPVRLRANFRSQHGLVDWFNITHRQILTRDDEAIGSVAYSEAQAVKEAIPDAVTVRGFPAQDYASEAVFICEQVEAHLRANDTDKIAILVRARGHLVHIVRELEKRGINFRAVKIDELAKRQTVLDLDALARAVLNEADRTAWLAVLRAPWCGLTLADLWSLCRGDRDSTIPDLIRQRATQLSADGRIRVEKTLSAMKKAQEEWSTTSLRLVVERLWVSLGGPAALNSDDRESSARDAIAYLDFLEERWAAGVRPGTRQFNSKLEELYASASTDPNIRVELLTIHGAKGLQWDVVFVPALGRVPKGNDKQLLYWREQRAYGRDELLLGPMRSVKVPDSEKTIECYLQSVAKERDKEERKRLLYVATTRAKKNLYLTANLKKDLGATSGSLLALLWQVPQFVQQIELSTIASPSEPTAVPVSSSTVPFRRLPPDFTLPGCPQSLVRELPRIADGEEERLHTFDWAGETRRRVGTVTHAFLQMIARDGIPDWNDVKVKNRAAAIKVALMTEGVGLDKIDAAVQEVSSALTNAVSDDRGRWILTSHDDASSELAVTAIVDGNPKRMKIDRTFVNEGVRWIVDFKTTQIEGGDPERFFAGQVEKYRQDLLQYSEAMRLLDDKHEIRAALYFPMQKEFRVVGF